jgi:hypothetical protein
MDAKTKGVTPDRSKQAQEKPAADRGPTAPKLSFYLGYLAKRVIPKFGWASISSPHPGALEEANERPQSKRSRPLASLGF